MSSASLPSRSRFPADFRFGAATSAYQIEGSSFGGCGTSHWDTFAVTPGNVVRGETGAIACDHYHRFAEDLDLVRDAGLDSYRFSISWPRVLPDGRGQPNAEGLDFYDRLTDAILERGLKPSVTLYHWDLPAALADLGGWRNRDIAGWFADYTELVMGRLGDRMDSIATINEPWCVAWLSHFLGIHAPGLRDIRAAAHAMHHVLLAHGRSIEVMRAMGIANLGIVTNFEHVEPASERPEDVAAASRYEGIYNRWFISAIFRKEYPADVLEGLMPHMPANFADDFDIIGRKLDWHGINYYTRQLIADDGSGLFPAVRTVEGPLPKTQMGWEIYPEGLYELIKWSSEEYSGGIPIRITENGLASPDTISGGKVLDEMRIGYLAGHMEMVLKAVEEGLPVKSYYMWSLLDNYEWALGYEKRFGLIHVDFETLERTPKESWHRLKAAMAS